MVATSTGTGRDERIEEWLEKHGAEYEYVPKLPLAEIDKEASLRNQARVSQKPLLEEFVQTFAAALENGDDFPPIVVFLQGDRYVVIDGNHRNEAAERAERDSFPAYVVTNPTPKRIAALTYEANTKHGIPTAPEERVIQAMYLVESGVTQATAARMLGIPREKLVRALNQRRTRERLQQMRIPRLDQISGTALERLTSIRDDPVLAEAAKVVADAGLNAEETGALVKQVNELRSEGEKLAEIQAERDRRKAQIEATLSGVFQLPPLVKRLASTTGAVLALDVDKYKAAGEMVPDPEYRELLAERASVGAMKLSEISRLLRG